MLMARLFLGILVLLAATPVGRAAPPPERLAALARGVNLANWFRYP